MALPRHIMALQGIIRVVLLCAITAACLFWVLYWMISSEPAGQQAELKYPSRLEARMRSRFFRTDLYYGSALIFQAAPFVVVALLSYAVVGLRIPRDKLSSAQYGDGGADEGRWKLAECWARMATYPVMVRSPWMGVVTGAEAVAVLGVLFLTFYSFFRITYLSFHELQRDYKLEPSKFEASLALTKVDYAAYYMGRSAMIPFCLLWIPVSRGSPFLRLIKLPFEHAVRYHIWLAVLTLFMLTVHSIGYIIYYAGTKNPHEIFAWDVKGEKCAVVAGFVAWIAGLLMWLTSLSFFRRRWYEVFFGVHHLYVVFFVFWLYHVHWTVHFVTIPVLLFLVDRFLRMLQSRKDVDVITARILESGSMELTLARNHHQGSYHPLSSWYLRFPSLPDLSKFQWHIFSVASTPLDEKPALSILIKPLGHWTSHLQQQLEKSTNVASKQETLLRCPFTWKARVDGPYGEENDFYLKYSSLILIAGGIGMTPLLAILRDILHRLRLQTEKGLPTQIEVYHCVRKVEELCVLNSLDPQQILPGYGKGKTSCDIHIHAYVTSQMDAHQNAMQDTNSTTTSPLDLAKYTTTSTWKPTLLCSPHVSLDEEGLSQNTKLTCNVISSIGSNGHPVWVAVVVGASILGFYVMWGLSNLFIVKSYMATFPNYSRVHLLVGSMMLGVGMFGGAMVAIWWGHLQRHSNYQPTFKPVSKDANDQFCDVAIVPQSTSSPHSHLQCSNGREESLLIHCSPWHGTLHLHCRPNWQSVFNTLAYDMRGKKIGVLVSGPQSMLKDVARECKRHSAIFDFKASSTIFHFHSVSFEI